MFFFSLFLASLVGRRDALIDNLDATSPSIHTHKLQELMRHMGRLLKTWPSLPSLPALPAELPSAAELQQLADALNNGDGVEIDVDKGKVKIPPTASSNAAAGRPIIVKLKDVKPPP